MAKRPAPTGECADAKKLRTEAPEESNGREDISVIVDDAAGTEIRAHSQVLMLASPVFEKMLTRDMAEKESQRIVLPGKCPKEFKVFLQFLQPVTGRQQKVTDKNVDFLVGWCDEYCIDSLKDECIEFIKGQPPSMHRLVQVHCFGLHEVAQDFIDHLIRKGEKDWKKVYAHPELMQKVIERTFKLMVPPCPRCPPPIPQGPQPVRFSPLVTPEFLRQMDMLQRRLNETQRTPGRPGT